MLLTKQIINGFIQTELELFKKQFDDSLVSEIQDDRSLAIAWVSYFFKELVSIENRAAIENYVTEIHHRDNYKTQGWYRIAALESASFILSNNTAHRDTLLNHISCGQSWARSFIIESAGIICPLLEFSNDYLRESTELNIKFSHSCDEENTVLFLCAKGTVIEKQNWLKSMMVTEKDCHLNFFEGLITNGKLYQTGFFVRAFNKAKSYFIFKILTEPVLAVQQPELFDEIKITFDDLIALEKKHPLNDFYIDLDFLSR